MNPQAAVSIERNIANVLADPNQFNISPAFETERIQVEGKLVIRVWVPMGPVVYQYHGVVYDRMADIDVKVRGTAQLNMMYLRKSSIYTERRVYPWVSEDDLRLDLLPRVRSMIKASRSEHPWLKLDDHELLRAARLCTRDPETGDEGFTLASVVLIGKDETILSVLPTYRTDAILRRKKVDRYVDRLVVETNLIEAFDQLTEFCDKWLPDSFVLEGSQRVSARDGIVRELVANSLMHRE